MTRLLIYTCRNIHLGPLAEGHSNVLTIGTFVYNYISLVTWRHGSGRALVIVRKGRGLAFSDRQIAACAQATVHKPPTGRARSSSAQAAVKKRTKKEKENIQRSLALGYRKSKSLTNLAAAAFDADSNPFTGQVRRNNQSLSASCSALDLPLPPKPTSIQMSTLYEDQEQRKSAFLNVQNVAYTTNEELSCRPPHPPPYSETPAQGPVYEQLDLV